MASPPGNTLAAIEQKVRRLTRSPSVNQLSTADLDNYINTFIVYDFPEHIRTFNLRKTFTFQCNPFQDVYATDTTVLPTSPLYNFQNLYITVHPPVYIAGYKAFFTQSREQFFGIYPFTNSILSIGQTGDGVTTTFSGTIPLSGSFSSLNPNILQQNILMNNVLFSSVDTNNNGLALVDVPVAKAANDSTPTVNGNLYVPGTQPATPPTVIDPTNTINYVTGAFTITFTTAPATGETINSQTVPVIPTIPQALLWYGNQFTLRPVPDQPYQINFEVYARPTALLSSSSVPQLEEWWQYISYGAAKKIFEDRMDMDSVMAIMPEFKKQEALCLRRTIVQYTNERTATIYTEQSAFGPGSGAWGWGGSSF